LLVGRKLLLADDSVTIQKVVDLTFADEGIKVISVNDGKEAIEKLNEMTPDVVLADVFMPKMSGYEVCEYIKKNDELKHIPVILLVGSFEPFDEAEARRVGADDTLTKPFQSIRRLIDKVGGLIGGRPEAAVGVAGSPQPPQEQPQASETSVAAGPEVAPADTRLAEDAEVHFEESQAPGTDQREEQPASSQDFASETKLNSQSMQGPVSEIYSETSLAMEDAGEVLLELDDFDSSAEVSAADDLVLDLDFDGPSEPAQTEASTYSPSANVFAESSQPTTTEADATSSHTDSWAMTAVAESEETADFVEESLAAEEAADESQLETTQEWVRVSDEVTPATFVAEPVPLTPEAQAEPLTAAAEPISAPLRPEGQISLDQLSPEAIDAIARRAIEQLSEKVVQEIAWEVVPQLAELLIKRRLEEKESQTQ